ncbi:MAG: 3-deoxy-manno-octulosonate-8-phosphatase [Cytophagales bacterium]|nr:3-deoxy-manno-octulosonate-8-phosphatase [Cytophagales bacterium]
MELILNKYTPGQVAKASKIKAVVFDVDGVLTGGEIIYSNTGDELKQFNVKDGLIIKHLKNHGILTGAITGRTSQLVQKRCEELKLDFFYQGARDKWMILKKEIDQLDLKDHETCYIGDDLIDLKSLVRVGLSVSPSDAPGYIKDHVDLVASCKGGQGVVREVADLVLASQGALKQIVKECL